MINSKLYTIAPHLDVIPNKYELARVVMLRTRQLINGARYNKQIDPALKPRKRQPLPNSRAPKVALNEILLGSVRFERAESASKSDVFTDDIIFTAN